MDNDSTAFWIEILQSGSVNDLEYAFQNDSTATTFKAVPKNLLHLACEHGADLALLQCLLDHAALRALALDERDDKGKIPLHYVCLRARQSLSTSLSLLHLLLQAAPDTILMRTQEDDNNHNDDNNNNNDDDDGTRMLPSILAHNQGAPPTVVQFLLRRQIQAHQGLVLRHTDLAQLHWNEEVFLEQLAKALHQVPPECIQRIVLEDCRLTYASWKLLQTALEKSLLPQKEEGSSSSSSWTELRLMHLHIWHTTSSTSNVHHPHPQQHVNMDEEDPPQQPSSSSQNKYSCWKQQDTDLWRRIVDRHKATLTTLELPHFYALNVQSVHCIAHWLAQEQFSALQVLDIRSLDQKQPTRRYPFQQSEMDNPNSFHHQSNRRNKKTRHVSTIPNTTNDVAHNLAKALGSPSCQLQSLALESLAVSGFQQLLQCMKTNRTVRTLKLESIVSNDDDNDSTIPWTTLQTALIEMLQYNSALERIVGPRRLIQNCRQIQLYLQLNRQYHRRDIGHWSPTLVAHVLAKTLWLRQQEPPDSSGTSTPGGANDDHVSTTNSSNNHPSAYFPTHEPTPEHDPKSTMFYILQSRPDILKSKQ